MEYNLYQDFGVLVVNFILLVVLHTMNYSFDYFLYCYSNTVFCAPYHSTIPKDLPCCIPKPIYAFIIGQIMIFC